MATELASSKELVSEIKELRERIHLAEEALRAIRANEIDALVVGSDGSERVRTLSGADLCYRTFVETMGQGAATVSADGTILYCNAQFCALLRSNSAITTGASIFSFVAPEDEGLLRAMLWEAVASSGTDGHFSLRACNGARISALVTATPMMVESVMGICVVITDLTEHEARLAAEAANKSKDRFLAVLSHELRTPLTPAYMAVSALESDTSLPQEAREELAMIRGNLELETRLIDDLLELSRVMNGKLRLRSEPLSVHSLVPRVAEMLRSDMNQKSLKLKLELNAKDTVNGDSSRLQQVLWNLLKNAIKFSNEGGEVSICTSNPDASSLRIGIRDEGVGIDPQVMPRIFDAFEQGDQALMRRQGGLGLGLSIAKPIVEAHGGTIVAESAGVGTGATFTITLPACSDAPLPIGRNGNGDGAKHGKSCRVLVVEDHVETAKLLKRFLERCGHSVSVAGSVRSAMELAENGRFDILVSDIGLPDATGYELMKQVKARHGIPGIALTGYGMDDDLTRSREAGFEDHVVKPVDADQLEQVICRIASCNGKAS